MLFRSNKYDITVKVSGGGPTGQIEAIRLGIAKALTLLNEDYKQTLKRADLLGRDSREKERIIRFRTDIQVFKRICNVRAAECF